MLNVILRGSQYIYQNLIKNHLVCSSHLKGTSEFPAQRSLPGQRRGQRHLRGCVRAEPAAPRLLQAREPRRVLLQKEESPFGLLSCRQNIRVDPRLPSRVPPVGTAPAARSRDELPVIYSAFRPL